MEANYRLALQHEPEQGVYYYNLGNLAFGQREYGEAAKWYRLAIGKDPSNHEYRAGLATALMEEEEYEDALAQLDVAIRLSATAAYYFNKGRCLFKLERYYEAAQAFEHAAGLEPGNANIFNWWGSALSQHGYLEEAAEVFTKAVALDQHQHQYHLMFDGLFYTLGHANDEMRQNFSSPIL